MIVFVLQCYFICSECLYVVKLVNVFVFAWILFIKDSVTDDSQSSAEKGGWLVEEMGSAEASCQ